MTLHSSGLVIACAALLVCACGVTRAAGTSDAAPPGQAPLPSVGSKAFTESIVLADVLQLLAQRQGLTLQHKRSMGGSVILWRALLDGSIDAYAEYTGTLTQQLLHGLPPQPTVAQIGVALASRGLAASASIGFEDRYALAVPEPLAARLHLRVLSDLRTHPELRYALSNEFMRRDDGWPGLRRVYGLAPRSLRGVDHTLGYRAIRDGATDVVDVYTTDPEIQAYRLRVLEDDRHYFPNYQAVWLYRLDAVRRWPTLLATIRQLSGQITVTQMRRLNAAVQISGEDDMAVARRFVVALPATNAGTAQPSAPLSEATAVPAPPPAATAPAPTNVTSDESGSLVTRVLARTYEHLALVGLSLGLAVLVGLPLGVTAAKLPRFGRAVLSICVVLQTVPSLAMLVFMIPLFGIGAKPAIAALFLYSLLPIVRNTLTALSSIPAPLAESAASLGLPGYVRLLRIELPLASRTILAGVSTAAVINVGTATLGALIGAGGYGDPILTGIRLDNLWLILEGAIPAAVLALLVMAAFQLLERALTPRGLRQFRDDRTRMAGV